MQQKYSDEELVALICSKDDKYYQLLLKRYMNRYPGIVLKTASDLKRKNVDPDDFLLLFYISFEIAIKKFDSTQCKFSSFLYLIFRRSVKNELLKDINSHDMINHAISLDNSLNDALTLYEVVEDINADDPVFYAKTSDMRLYLRGSNKRRLSPKEELRREAFILRSEGLTLNEISKKLNIHISKVRRLLDPETNKDLKNIYIQLK